MVGVSAGPFGQAVGSSTSGQTTKNSRISRCSDVRFTPQPDIREEPVKYPASSEHLWEKLGKCNHFWKGSGKT